MKRNAFVKGVTLIEVLVASIISVIAMAGVVMFITQNAKLSSNSQVKSEAYDKLNFVSRQLELKIKEGANVVTATNNKSILIYDYQNNFVVGYLIDGNDKLRRCNASLVDQGDFSPLTANCKFTGSTFKKDNPSYAYFDLKMQVYDLSNNLKIDVANFSFFSKCRSLYSN